MTDRDLMQKALDALENHCSQRTLAGGVVITNVAIALRERLSYPISPVHGCVVCGKGAGQTCVIGYGCTRDDCPTRVSYTVSEQSKFEDAAQTDAAPKLAANSEPAAWFWCDAEGILRLTDWHPGHHPQITDVQPLYAAPQLQNVGSPEQVPTIRNQPPTDIRSVIPDASNANESLGVHTCHDECQRAACIAQRAARMADLSTWRGA